MVKLLKSELEKQLKNSIVATNTAANGSDVYSASALYTSNGFNLIGQDASNVFPAMSSDIENANPLLAPLANNGGPTFTHALQTNSPAFDKGDPADTFSDQRGSVVFGASRDMGAYEAQTTLGIDAVTFSGKSIIYPNPSTNGFVSIQLPSDFGTEVNGRIIEIGTGKIVKEFKMNQPDLDLNLSAISHGIYIIQLTSDTKKENHKLILGR